MKNLKMLVTALALLVGASRVQAQAGSFVVVVHESNPVSAVKSEELSKIFLKKITVWRTKRPVVVVDQGETTKIRAEFTRDVHHRGLASVESYWQSQIFSGRAVPPQQRQGDAEVMAFVAANPDAIGYVSANTPLAPGVKAIAIQ